MVSLNGGQCLRASEKQIFFDKSGRRWKITKISFAALFIAAVLLINWLLPLSLAQIKVPAFLMSSTTKVKDPESSKISPDVLAGKVDSTNTPVIGAGPLVRVVRVVKNEGKYISVDPFSDTATSRLSNNDLIVIGNHDYAIQRYGYINGKKIALTFDDGPDSHYTSQLLNILSKNHVPASFFLIGRNLVEFPKIAQREVREGHIVGNHTLNHVDFNYVGRWRAVQEINQTQHIIRAVTGRNTAYFRPPYVGNDDQSLRDGIKTILYAQDLGYTITSYDYDSNDWQFPTGYKPVQPKLNGSSMVILVHDAGGDRSRTLTYVQKLISNAKAKGYSFVNLQQMYPQNPSLFPGVQPTLADNVSYSALKMVLVWPHSIIMDLFMFTVGLLLITMIIQLGLATAYSRQAHFGRRAKNYYPQVTAVIPAYNEERVIERTIMTMLLSRYRNLDVIVVDDGSKDGTWDTIQNVVRQSDRVTAFKQTNRGKAAALNKGIRQARGEIIICLDADTIFMPQTISNLVRHFKDPQVGAVSGSVKVGNIQNMLTRWQGLEYITGINVERSAQAFLKAILIIPGACCAWRKQALIKARRYSAQTLAEDCDLTLRLQRTAYKIIQDNTAISYTEAPLKLRSLVRQRFRWVFGNVQAFWKNRDMIFRRKYGWLGMYVLPNALLTTIIPLLFWPLLVIVTLENLVAGRYIVILVFASAILALNFVFSFFGLMLAGERLRFLIAVPFSRLIYGPIRTYILYSTLIAALKGAYVSWNKLTRTGTVKHSKQLRLHRIKAAARV
jgi:cellulose synthase/poly-beta-1,6-N-acetylglucosamine synthase-like glycosyltransferase/peptidoglycan/xylan/chitin deacetylase (PgdA/CDA1 family)